MVSQFLRREQSEVGWRFWLLWVLATNLGFFPGIAIGNYLSVSLAEPVASAVVGGCFGALVGVAQWTALRRHLAPSIFWVTATALGWAFGGGLGALLLIELLPSVPPGGLVWIVVNGFVGGAVVGVPQYVVLHKFDPILSSWWVPISSLAWGIFFPGAVSGAFLAARLRRVA